MANIDLLVSAWDEGNWELSEALRELPDDLVWKRPHPALLSIGEIVGHISYYEAILTTAPGPTRKPNLADLPIKSPLIDERFTYYSNSIDEPVVLEMSAAELASEVKRIHEEAKAAVLQVAPDGDDMMRGFENTTWGHNLKYLVFHVAYHSGQIYSARHLMGNETPDN